MREEKMNVSSREISKPYRPDKPQAHKLTIITKKKAHNELVPYFIVQIINRLTYANGVEYRSRYGEENNCSKIVDKEPIGHEVTDIQYDGWQHTEEDG
jgi:hypothetical protein